ncbi:MAG: MFS transporter [Clostridia bacterium]|nr:MFS transporter [Clostridia bacterium]
MKTNYRSTLAACYLGYITQAITINLIPLFFVIFGERYGVSYSELGSLVLLTFVIQIAVDASMIKLTYIIGYRISAVAAHVLSAAGLLLLGILPHFMPPYAAILVSVSVYAIGGGMTEVVISPIVESLPGDAKASSMSLLHSFYSWGLVAVVSITTVILRIVGDDLWYIIPMLWAAVPFFNIFFFSKVPLVPITKEAESVPLSAYFKSPVMYVAIVLMICGGASEMAMSQWASLFAESGLGVTKVLGDLLGPCLFAIFMGLGRTVYGMFGSKINIKKALLGCAVMTVICYITTVFANAPLLSLAGCALCGFGVSLMWPGVLSMTSAEFGVMSGPALFAFLALAGDVGCSLGPWITGKVSDAYLVLEASATGSDALRAGLLAACVFPVIMIFGCTVMLMSKNKRNK